MSSIIQFLYFSLFFFTPLIFTSVTSELFEVPKMYFVYFITLFILFFHLINWLKGKTILFSKNKFTIPLSIFFSTQLLSTFFSVDPHTSFFGYYSRLNGGLLSLFTYFLLFLIFPLYLTPKFRDKIINVFLVSGFLISSYGILEHFGIDKSLWIQDVQSRVFSTLGQPNWLAAYLCILLPFAINKFLISKIYSLKSFFFLFLVSTFYLCLLFTKSKSGIIAAIISTGIYFIFYFVKNFKNSTVNKVNFNNSKDNQFKKEMSPLIKGGWGVFIILTIFIILSLSISNPIKDYLFPLKISSPIDQNSTLNITKSEDIRKIVWQGSIDLWKKFPFFGTGPETFAYSYYWTRPASHNLTSEWDFLYNKAHNEYLNYLATTGTFGFLTYIFFIFSVLYLIIKNIFPSQSGEGSGVGLNIAILTSFISILITNFAGFSVVIISLFFFLLPLLFLSETSLQNNKTKNKLLFLPLIAILIFLFIKLLSFLIADITYNQSQSYFNHQQFTVSQSFINISVFLRPKEAIYRSQASLIAAKLNQIDAAVNNSNIALSLSPSSTNLWKERAQVFSLISLTKPEYFSYAIDALEKCARLAPTDAKTFFLLGKFYDAASQKESAIKSYQKALDTKSNYDHAAFALGEIYYNDKNYSEAKKYFESTLKIAPTNLDAQNYLSLIATSSTKRK